jgi:hypothetical protein
MLSAGIAWRTILRYGLDHPLLDTGEFKELLLLYSGRAKARKKKLT